MNLVEFREKLESWMFPLGPFRSIDEVYDEMEAETHNLGASAVTELVKTLLVLADEEDSLLEILGEFLDMYSRHYSDALAEALLQQLRPTGPPILVSLLGCTENPHAIEKLEQVLNLNEATDDLLEALAGTLGDIGGSKALTMLQDLQTKDNLSPQVQDEIHIALANIADVN